MNWLPDLTLKTKIAFVILLGGGAVSFLLYQNYVFTNDIGEQRILLLDIETPAINISSQLQLDFNEMNDHYELAASEGNEKIGKKATDMGMVMYGEMKRLIALLPTLRSQVEILQGEIKEYVDHRDRYVKSAIEPLYVDRNGELLESTKSAAAQLIIKSKDSISRKLINLGKTLDDRYLGRIFNVLLKAEKLTKTNVTAGTGILVLIVLIAIWFVRLIVLSIENGIQIAGDIADGQWDININIDSNSQKEMGRLVSALKNMRNSLREQNDENQRQDLGRIRSARLHEKLRGELTLKELADRVLACMNKEINTLVGAFYVYEGDHLQLISGYAHQSPNIHETRFKLGETLVGQCGLERKPLLVDDVPDGYLSISAGLGSLNAKHLFLVPLLYNGDLTGVLELARFEPFLPDALAFIETSAEGIAIALDSVRSRVELGNVLSKTQLQAKTLEVQQRKLRKANEELEQQAQELRTSEGNLQAQQEELKVLNEELEERARLLDNQKTLILEKNKELEESHLMLQRRSSESNSTDQIELKPKSRTLGPLMIVEDDPNFSSVLKDVAGEYGVEAIVMGSAEEAIGYMDSCVPAAIILDMGLPGMKGDEFIEYLNNDTEFKDIPVHVLSGTVVSEQAADLGVANYLEKPVALSKINDLFTQIKIDISTHVKHLLIIEDNEIQGNALREQFEGQEVSVDVARSGEEATAILRAREYDYIVLDLNLSDCDGFDLLKEMRSMDKLKSIPIVIYTAMDVDRQFEEKLNQYADRIILKAGNGMQRVHDEAALFLNWVDLKKKYHPVEVELTDTQVETDSVSMSALQGKRILLVDDDVRNLYSLTTILEDYGVHLDTAVNGRQAVDKIFETRNVTAESENSEAYDLVLMDIMMPEMDGYEAMTLIRAERAFSKLPIIAVTAKAMKEDRLRCLQAGASDYLTKPVEVEKLIGILKVWLGKAG